jgi:glycosyltransferase involved in cell wall biosynthesis
MCGPPDARRDALFNGRDRVRVLGKVPRKILLGLMSSASVVVVPSVYEGFGLPALEGMACGTPVVAAAASALPEVCGNAALLAEPTAQGLAAALCRVLRDDALASALRSRGRGHASKFTWQASAMQHLAAYKTAFADLAPRFSS